MSRIHILLVLHLPEFGTFTKPHTERRVSCKRFHRADAEEHPKTPQRNLVDDIDHGSRHGCKSDKRHHQKDRPEVG